MPAAGIDLPLVQLLFNAPAFPTYDLLEEALTGGDFSEYASLGFDATTVSGDLFTPEGLQLLADVYAEGIGPSLSLVLNADGTTTSLVDDAHAADLLVHAYTHRDETEILGPDGQPLSPEAYFTRIIETGVDGVFTDNSDTGRAAVDAIWGQSGPDPDDPAIYVNKRDAAASTVVTTMKNGGLRVYDLDGEEIQRIEPEGVRYNNVDVLYDVRVGWRKMDLAVASDRENDTLAIYRINKRTGELTDVTSNKIPASIFGVDDGEATAYGLAAYTSLVTGESYVFVTQADGASIAQLRLTTERGGKVGFETVRILDLPVAAGDDPEDYQAEGIVIDRETGIGYVAVEEELGLLSFEAELGGSDDFTVVADIDSGLFEPDLEGVSIHYGENGEGLIVVSSQGDSSFTVFDRAGGGYLGSFAIRGEGGIDGVEESDGLDIFSGALPGFEDGLLVTQDGSNEIEVVFGDPDDGEIQNFNVNFKYSDLGDVLSLFGAEANPDFDPRDIDPQTLPNGVAAGDVTEESVVLWTRSLVPGQVTFKVFEVTKFGWKKLVAKEKAFVTDSDVPVKVVIDDLEDGTTYVYEVTDAAGDTATGTFNTVAEDGHNGLTFGVTGDWRGELAPYPAIANAIDAGLDFMLLHGDTIYADFPSPALPIDQAVTVDDFRTKHAEVYGTRSGENFWADLRASTAIYANIDDHEVTNDFAGGSTIGTTAESEFRDLFPGDDPERLCQRQHACMRTACRRSRNTTRSRICSTARPATTAPPANVKLYRAQEFGQDAAFIVLDQRSFRDEQIDGVTNPADVNEVIRFQVESFDPTRTLLGRQQMEDLKADLLAAHQQRCDLEVRQHAGADPESRPQQRRQLGRVPGGADGTAQLHQRERHRERRLRRCRHPRHLRQQPDLSGRPGR